MDNFEDLEEKIELLKKRLGNETSSYKKALTQTGGYNEAKKLFLKARNTDNELREAVHRYNSAAK